MDGGKMDGRKNRRGKTSPCIFRRIADGKAEAYRVEEDKLSPAILDINPFTQGRCRPKRFAWSAKKMLQFGEKY
jgi:hypothetical protein